MTRAPVRVMTSFDSWLSRICCSILVLNILIASTVLQYEKQFSIISLTLS